MTTYRVYLQPRARKEFLDCVSNLPHAGRVAMTNPIRITYDPEGDILFVTFGAPTPSTGYQLSDQLLLRVNPDSLKATGLTILNFSVHARSRTPIALSGLRGGGTLPLDAVRILTSAPVNRFLRLSEDEKGVSALILQPALDEAVAA